MAAVIRPQTTPKLNQPRYNIYITVHKGLRGFMADTLLRWGKMDVEDDCERATTIEQARALLALCKSHLEHENHFIHVALERKMPGCTAALAQDHEEHLQSIGKLQGLLIEIEAASVSHRRDLARSFYQALSVFIAENFEHMIVEETDNFRLLIEAYSEEDVIGIEQAIIASLSPEEDALWQRWMIGQSNASERAFMLGGMKRGAPPEVFEGAMNRAREVLTQRDYYKLERALA